MTAASGDPGEKPDTEASAPAYGSYNPHPAPPPAPPYGGYPPPAGYSAPPGYIPPPEFGGPYPGGYYPTDAWGRPTGTNSLAIFSLVASVIGLLCGVGSIVGIVLGVVALGQIKRTGQDGHGLAVTGIAVGAASLVISVVWLAVVATSH